MRLNFSGVVIGIINVQNQVKTVDKTASSCWTGKELWYSCAQVWKKVANTCFARFQQVITFIVYPPLWKTVGIIFPARRFLWTLYASAQVLNRRVGRRFCWGRPLKALSGFFSEVNKAGFFSGCRVSSYIFEKEIGIISEFSIISVSRFVILRIWWRENTGLPSDFVLILVGMEEERCLLAGNKFILPDMDFLDQAFLLWICGIDTKDYAVFDRRDENFLSKEVYSLVFDSMLGLDKKLKRSCRDRQGEFIRWICSWNQHSDQRDFIFILEPHIFYWL